MKSRQAAIQLAILSSMLSSLAWIFQGEAIRLLSPLAVASTQGLFTGVLYLIHLRRSKLTSPIEQLRTHTKEFSALILLRGVISSILICYALSLSTSIKVMFFTKLEPYFVLFWIWLLRGEKISRYHFILLLIHVAGAILLSTSGQLDLRESQAGDLLLIVAVGISSLTYLYAGELSKKVGSIHVNGICSTISGIMLLPAAIIFSPGSIWSITAPGWIDLIILVLLFNVFGLTLWYSALKHLDGWLVSALRALGPVFAAPIAWLFFDQSLSFLQITGALIVLLTSVMLARDRQK